MVKRKVTYMELHAYDTRNIFVIVDLHAITPYLTEKIMFYKIKYIYISPVCGAPVM
jgi:hypothetical protein